MKKLHLSVLALGLVCVGASPVYADLSGSATASVFVDVNPNISVSPRTVTVDAGDIQTGEVEASIVFAIGANQEQVSMSVEASDLFKGDNPLGTDVLPIPLNTNRAAELTIPQGNEMNGGDNRAIWTVAGANIGNFPTMQTETVTYESSQNGHFSQDVTVSLYYTQSDPEKTVGQYGGKVRLTALITP